LWFHAKWFRSIPSGSSRYSLSLDSTSGSLLFEEGVHDHAILLTRRFDIEQINNVRLVILHLCKISQDGDKTVSVSILINYYLTSLSMAPPFIPEDEQLLLTIRNAVKTHRKGTWGNTTILYNNLVPSRVSRTQDSLQNRYKIMNVEQVQGRIQVIDNSVLEKAVQRTFQKMLNVSVYAVEYSELIPQKKSGTRARTQIAGAQQTHRCTRNTFIRSTKLSIASQRVSHQSRCAGLLDFEVDDFAHLTSEILQRLDMLDQELKRQYSRMR
jgi:hypothetical protein